MASFKRWLGWAQGERSPPARGRRGAGNEERRAPAPRPFRLPSLVQNPETPNAAGGGPRVKEARRLAAAAARITKNAGRKLLGRSDYNRWSNTENLESWWGARTEKIVGFIRPGARVVEFGAGSRHLEKLLDKSCVYFASDLVNRGSGTIVCDLNKRPLPDLTELSADVAVFSGVLEYIRDLDSLVA